MTPSNKGMKLTSVERIGRSQLIPGVRRTSRGWTMTPATIGLIALIGATHPGQGEEQSSPLRIEVRTGATRVVCSGDGLTYSSIVALRLRITNQSGGVLIVANEFKAAPWLKAAASIADAAAGRFAYDFGGHEYWPGEWHPPKFAKKPDAGRFEVLNPGAASERTVEIWVISTESPGGIHGLLSANETYVVQTGIRTWPYWMMSEKDVAEVAKRWRSSGILVTSTLTTPLVPVTIPPTNGQCGSK